MPRIRRGPWDANRIQFPELVQELADELRSASESGQPRIEEVELPNTASVRVTVIWDKWEPVSYDQRTNTIVKAYSQVEGEPYSKRIIMADGYTFPEATALGLLPYAVDAAIRASDKVTLEQCRQAMIADGASVLINPHMPQLRFATSEEARACIARLCNRLPDSDQVWIVTMTAETTTTTTTTTPDPSYCSFS